MQNEKTGANFDDLGKLILRVSLALFILFHGIAKIIGGVEPIGGMLAKSGLPSSLAYLVYIGEVAAPILILVGIWTRAAALVIFINMIVAVWLAHAAEVFALSKTGGWALELQGMYLAASLTVALLGAGRHSMAGRMGRWN